MKKILLGFLIIIIVGGVIIIFIGRTFYPDNIAQTSPDGGKKGLKTRFYRTNIETAFKIVKEIIPTLSTYGRGWKISGESDEDGIRTVKAEVPVIVFTDDLEVAVKKTEKSGEVRIDVRSASRVGKSDFGENARHVRQVLNALDGKFTRTQPER